jgi:hypothetical protein
MKPKLIRDLFATLEMSPDDEALLDDLEFMARYKYDHYEMYAPGVRFMDQLVRWLRQFSPEDRSTALQLVRRRLIFISQREMQDLARFLYYNRIVPALLERIIEREQLRPYQFGVAFNNYFKTYIRQSIFIGLSDGAKIDFFRRHHIDLSQEQVIPYYRSSHEDYLASLRSELNDSTANFDWVFLIDDFIASGYTLIHEDPASSSGYSGSLCRVYSHHPGLIQAAQGVYVCHYITTRHALERASELASHLAGYQGKVRFLSALILERPSSVNSGVAGKDERERQLDENICRLCERYYSNVYEDENSRKGGGIKFGFGGIGLPLATYSNTPNNSIYLLWLQREADTNSRGFQPLFRRIDRHRQR